MGGHAFPDLKINTISSENVLEIYERFIDDVLTPYGITNHCLIGSYGNSAVVSDIDIAVQSDTLNFADDRFRFALFLKALNVKTKRAGSCVSVAWPTLTGDEELDKDLDKLWTEDEDISPIKSETSAATLVQIDVFFVSNLAHSRWLMSNDSSITSDTPQIYRNLLLAAIAKNRQLSLGFPTGLHCGANVITDPVEILKALDINCTPFEASTFESLLAVLERDRNHTTALINFELYTAKRKQVEPSIAEQAVSKVSSVLLREADRRLEDEKIPHNIIKVLNDVLSIVGTQTDDWVSIKKLFMLRLHSFDRARFSKRDRKTFKHSINDFERKIIVWWKERTDISLVLRHRSARPPSEDEELL